MTVITPPPVTEATMFVCPGFQCLRLDLAGDESARDLLEFAADPAYSVVASSFSSFQTTFDLEALHSDRGLLVSGVVFSDLIVGCRCHINSCAVLLWTRHCVKLCAADDQASRNSSKLR